MSGPEQNEQTAICWSYSQDGQRCAKPAGHPLEHEVVRYTRWTDEDAWTPERAIREARAAAEASILARGPHLVPVTTETPLVEVLNSIGGTCLNCEHAVHEDECAVMVGGKVPCGCNFHG